jgi:hypothetical protein
MRDLISRQAALALAKDICVPTGDGKVYRTRIIDPQEVRELPAIQPVAKDINVLTNDCISRQAAIDGGSGT